MSKDQEEAADSAPTADNNARLAALFQDSGLSLPVAMTLINRGQITPLTESTLKAYMASKRSRTRKECPQAVLELAQSRFNEVATRTARDARGSLNSDNGVL